MLDGHLNAREAFLLRAVVVVRDWQPGRPGSVEIGLAQGILVAGYFRGERPIAAAIQVRPTLPALLATEIRQHVRVGPVRQSLRRPARVVGPMATRIGQRVDRRGAAHHLPARALDAPAAEARNGLGLVHPVVAALREDLAPAERQMDPHVAVPSAGLEHEDANVIVLGQPVCERTAGGAGPDDDVVVGVFPHDRRSKLTLFGDLRTWKGVLDQLLLDRVEMEPHRLLGLRRIAVRNRDRNAPVGSGVFGLPVDAVSGLAAVAPGSFRGDLEHRVENRDQQRIARGDRDAAVEASIRLLVGERILGFAARLGRLEQLVDITGGRAQRSEPRLRRLNCEPHLQRVDRVVELGKLAHQALGSEPRIGDEGAAAPVAGDAALSLEHIERVPERAAAHAKLGGEEPLRRQPPGAVEPFSVDEASQPLQRQSLRVGRAHPRVIGVRHQRRRSEARLGDLGLRQIFHGPSLGLGPNQ